MALLVNYPLIKTVEEAYKTLKAFGVLIDFDKQSDLKVKNKIVFGQVFKIFPIYRRNEKCHSDDDCFSLQLRKAFPVESLLSEEPRNFRLLFQGDIITRLSHTQVNSFLAIKNPNFYISYGSSQEPCFIVDKSVRIVWEFPNLKLSEDRSQMLVPLTDGRKSPVNYKNSHIEDSEDSRRPASPDDGELFPIEERSSHRSPDGYIKKLPEDRPQMLTSLTNGGRKSSPVNNRNSHVADNEDSPRSPSSDNEKEVSETEEMNHYVRPRKCMNTLELSPILPKKKHCRSNGGQRYENLNDAQDSSCESYYTSKNSKPEKEKFNTICTKETNRNNAGSFNVDNRQLCNNTQSKSGQYIIKNNSCVQCQSCNHNQENNKEGGKIIYFVVDASKFRGCEFCSATSYINNIRGIDNCPAATGTCQIHSSILQDQALLPVRSGNNCNQLVHEAIDYNNTRSSSNHYSYENTASTPFHKMRRNNSMTPERGCVKDKLYRNNRMSPEQGHSNHNLCRRNGTSPELDYSKHKLERNNSMPPERDHTNNKYRKNLFNSDPDLTEYKRGRNNSVSYERSEGILGRDYNKSPVPGYSKHRSVRNNSKSPEPGRGKHRLFTNNSKSPEPGHSKHKLVRNNSKSPVPGHSKHKLLRNNSKSPVPGHSKHKLVRNKNNISPERDHPNIKKKKLYSTDANLSDLLIENNSPIDSVSSKRTAKVHCNNIGKQGEDSFKTEKFLLASRNKIEAHIVKENTNKKLKIQTSSDVEKCSESSDSNKQHVVQRNCPGSEDEQLFDDLTNLGNNSTSVQNSVDITNDETLDPTAIEGNLPNNITEIDSNSMVIEKPNENSIEKKNINTLENGKNKSNLNEEPVSDGCGLDSVKQDLDVNKEPQPSEILSQPYYDAEEGSTEIINFQVTECLDIIKTLSEQSFNSFKELFSAESDDFREEVLLTLRNLKKKARIKAVVIDMCPDMRLDPLSVVKGSCFSGCRQSFYINTTPYKIVKKPKCKCCRLITHYVCPSCSQENGKQNLMCLSFSFDLHVLYGQNVLSVAVNGNSAERFLGCTLSNYLAYSSVSSHVVSIMKKIIINKPPEDWKNAILLILNVKSIQTSTGQVILKVVNTYLGDSLIRRGCFISKEQL